jgi:hypothetical protein
MTTTQRILLPLGFLLALTAGCTDSTRGPIDFQVTGGFGGDGDGTPSLKIEHDGTMTVTSLGVTQATRLDRVTLDDLEAKVDAAQFATLDPTYPSTSTCLDCAVYNVSVQLAGTPYTVVVDETAQPPTALQAVITTLRDLARRQLDEH